MFFTKKIRVPENNETKLVEAVQLWEVRWTSRYGNFSTDTCKQVEVFTSEEKANEFKTALDNAFKLIRNRGDETKVYIYKAKSDI